MKRECLASLETGVLPYVTHVPRVGLLCIKSSPKDEAV